RHRERARPDRTSPGPRRGHVARLAPALASERKMPALDIVLGMQASRIEPAAAFVEEVRQETVYLEAHVVGGGGRFESKAGARERHPAAIRFVVAVEGEVEARVETDGAAAGSGTD